MDELKPALASNIAVYGLSHALVDATCAALLFSMVGALDESTLLGLIILYNVLAFGMQLPIGALSDSVRRPRAFAIAGAGLTGLSTLLPSVSPLSSIVAAGLGNALFHVGSGTISLNLTRGRATAPGLIVAPGAFGLLVGALIGRGGLFAPFAFVAAAAFAIAWMAFTRPPATDYDRGRQGKVAYVDLILILVLLSIVGRSFVGAVATFPWKTDMSLLLILTMAVVFGKAFGGIVGDRFGWSKVSVTSLVISAPLLAFGQGVPQAAIAGMFLFNFTMPITLVAVSNALPGRPGLSFGLNCFALLFGALPGFTEYKAALSAGIILLPAILASAVAVYLGLRFLSLTNPSSAP